MDEISSKQNPCLTNTIHIIARNYSKTDNEKYLRKIFRIIRHKEYQIAHEIVCRKRARSPMQLLSLSVLSSLSLSFFRYRVTTSCGTEQRREKKQQMCYHLTHETACYHIWTTSITHTAAYERAHTHTLRTRETYTLMNTLMIIRFAVKYIITNSLQTFFISIIFQQI